MIFIWRGLGFWIPTIPIMSVLLDILVFDSALVFTYTATISGYVLITYYGYKLNKNPYIKYKNVKTGEVFEVYEPHEFFFIPMQYWAIGILCVIGIILSIKFFSFIDKFAV